jgi:hypothetical protein
VALHETKKSQNAFIDLLAGMGQVAWQYIYGQAIATFNGGYVRRSEQSILKWRVWSADAKIVGFLIFPCFHRKTGLTSE